MGGQQSYVAPDDVWVSTLAADPGTKQHYESQRANYANEGDWYAAYGGGDNSPFMTPQLSNEIFTKLYGTYTPPPAAPAPAPAPTPDPAPAPAAYVPDPGPALATEPTGTPVSTGGAVAGPSAAGNGSPSIDLGNNLGSAVLKPPQYWVGGVDSVNTSKRGPGSLRTSN